MNPKDSNEDQIGSKSPNVDQPNHPKEQPLGVSVLYAKYQQKYGSAPKEPEEFMRFCRGQGVNLKYSECTQFLRNLPSTTMQQDVEPQSAIQQQVGANDFGDDKKGDEMEQEQHPQSNGMQSLFILQQIQSAFWRINWHSDSVSSSFCYDSCFLFLHSATY